MKLLPFRRPGRPGSRGGTPMSPEEVAARRLKRWTVGLMAAGFTAAIVIYVLAASPADNPLGYDPMDTKQYVHDLEVYGGQANVLAAQFERWFLDLWRGRN